MANNHNSNTCKFIDQTLMTLCHKQASNEELLLIINNLVSLGVDVFELDRAAIKYLEMMNDFHHLTFAYRIDSCEIEQSFNTYHRLQSRITYGIISYENSIQFHDMLKAVEKRCNNQLKIIIEVKSASFTNLIQGKDMETIVKIIQNYNGNQKDKHNEIQRGKHNEIQKVKYNGNHKVRLEAVRICGLGATTLLFAAEELEQLQRELSIPIAISPSNQSHMATAIATEAMRAGVAFITTHFNGGIKQTCAPLEEVAMVREVLLTKYNPITNELSVRFSFLPSMTQTYSTILGETISPMKPIIGEDIFKYESGIHADGIAKNHATYEPYAPELVGQQRELLLGKHSGAKSLRSKLEEWKLTIADQHIPLILEKIKEQSIEIHGKINEQEMISLLNTLGNRDRVVGAD